MSTSAAKLRSHGLTLPTSEDVRRALHAGTTDNVATLWVEVCAAADVAPTQDRLSVAELERISAALTQRSGTAGLVGRAMGVRVATYRELAELGADAPPPSWDWARVAMDKLLRERCSSSDRQQELLSLDPFAPELSTDLDQVASRVAQRLGTVFGGIVIVLDGAQVIVGKHGPTNWMVEAGGAPVEWSFCATISRTGTPYVIPDTTKDVIHRYNPIVVHDGARSYAGAPLVTASGEVLGSCCVFDPAPREFSEADMAALTDEAAGVIAELERRRDLRGKRRAARESG